ncbi:MAG: hypothetical protein QG597_4365 [Actinomycetota bacterium]|nr:hypothetical protein [Actinomycetota bacterium]
MHPLKGLAHIGTTHPPFILDRGVTIASVLPVDDPEEGDRQRSGVNLKGTKDPAVHLVPVSRMLRFPSLV